MQIFVKEFIDKVQAIVKESPKPISRPEVCKKLKLPPEYAEAISVAVKLGEMPEITTKRGITGGLVVIGRVYPDAKLVPNQVVRAKEKREQAVDTFKED